MPGTGDIEGEARIRGGGHSHDFHGSKSWVVRDAQLVGERGRECP